MTREQFDTAFLYRQEIERHTVFLNALQSFSTALIHRNKDFSYGLSLSLPYVLFEGLPNLDSLPIYFDPTTSIRILELLISFVRNEKDVAESALTALLNS